MSLASSTNVFPIKPIISKGKSAPEGKKSKVRAAGMAAASATGEKLPIFIIGKSKNSCCFKNIKHLSCQYVAQKKNWMNSQLFEDWVRKLDL